MNRRPQLVLASASPRRLELLAAISVNPVVRATDIDESPRLDETGLELVRRLAVTKARSDARSRELRVAADTIVLNEGTILGKPDSDAAAVEMLRQLSGKTHQVATAVALFDVDRDHLDSVLVTTEVTFSTLASEEISDYVACGEASDKAGAYGIQGRAAIFVTEICGSYSNVVGLPLAQTYHLFRRLGYDLREFTGNEG